MNAERKALTGQSGATGTRSTMMAAVAGTMWVPSTLLTPRASGGLRRHGYTPQLEQRPSLKRGFIALNCELLNLASLSSLPPASESCQTPNPNPSTGSPFLTLGNTIRLYKYFNSALCFGPNPLKFLEYFTSHLLNCF